MIAGKIYEGVPSDRLKNPFPSRLAEKERVIIITRKDKAEFAGLTSAVIIYTCHDSL